jgi:hypothetical protein
MSKGSLYTQKSSRLIYLLVFLVIALPLVVRVSFPPARLKAAEKIFSVVESIQIKKGEIALVGFDFGPGTRAENEPQGEVLVEHLMRRRIPFVVFTQYVKAQGFIDSIPQKIAQRLERESQGAQKWEYGKDWVTLGYRPGLGLFLQALVKSNDLPAFFGKDFYNTEVKNLPLFQGISSYKNVSLVAELTGLQGIFDAYVQFLQADTHRPPLVHGCTSVAIPEAYVFLDSGQLKGLFEGVSGAAWYSHLLSEKFPNREKDNSGIINTSLGAAQLCILLLVLVGNVTDRLRARGGSSHEKGVTL